MVPTTTASSKSTLPSVGHWQLPDLHVHTATSAVPAAFWPTARPRPPILDPQTQKAPLSSPQPQGTQSLKPSALNQEKVSLSFLLPTSGTADEEAQGAS